MKILRTVENAKKDYKELQNYLFLVENYEATTMEKKVLIEYTYLGSIVKVAEKINLEIGSTIDSAYVSQLIQSKPQDELHKVIRSSYLLKTRSNRKKRSSIW